MTVCGSEPSQDVSVGSEGESDIGDVRLACSGRRRAGATRRRGVDMGGGGGVDFEAAWRAVSESDVLTLTYTSSATGDPKGVELAHASVLLELWEPGGRGSLPP